MISRFSRVCAALLGVLLFAPLSAFAQTPTDPGYVDQWYLPKIGAPSAWDVTQGSSDIVVAVLDTGVTLNHPDLAANIWTNAGEIAGNGKDDDHNGFVDDVHGYDFVDEDGDPAPHTTNTSNADALSHGTFIAGIIAAQANNGRGYAGIAWNVKIMPVRMLDEVGAGSEGDAARAIEYAVANGADVINLSFAGKEAHRAFRLATHNAYDAGVVVVAALGNEGKNVNTEPVFPACLSDWVIGVAATDDLDEETQFTNYGSDCADISAPGQGIVGLGYTESTNANDEAWYEGPWNGTSLASPIIAGSAALLLSKYPSLTPDQVEEALVQSVDPAQTLSGFGAIGAGRVNIAQALAVAANLAVGAPVDEDEGTETNEPPVFEDDESEPTGEPEEDPEEDGSYKEDATLSFIALGNKPGYTPTVTVYRGDGLKYTAFDAYSSSFRGGVHVAVDDLDDDDKVEIVTAPGKGGGPHIRVFTVAGALMTEFFAYDPNSHEGASVALGDMTGDGIEEIVTAVGGGVSDDVVVFDQAGKELSRFTVSGFAPMTHYALAVADVDDDWQAEVVIAAMDGAPHVEIFNADGTHIVGFDAYAPNMTAGLTVSAGDFDGDARDEIVITPQNPGAGHVRMFNKIGAMWGEFFITDIGSGEGASGSVADIDVDGAKEIITVPAGVAGPIRMWTADGTLMSEIPDAVGVGGAYVGAW